MLDVKFIRDNKDFVKERLAVRNFKELNLVDEVISLDNERKLVQLKLDGTQSVINLASKQIGELIKKDKKEEIESFKRSVALAKSAGINFSQELTAIENQLKEKILLLPNLPSTQVPAGKTPEDNIVVREGGSKPQLPANAVPHWDLAKKYNLIDFELGNKITGSGFPFYVNKGAKLQRALIQYFLDYNTAAGYKEYQPPLMVNATTAFGTGQLPDKEGQMYYVNEDKFYLIPTAEVPITNIYRDEIVKENDLPIKMTAYTPCFRREAGSYGKDVRGLNRLHQFDKVEIVQLADPQKSYDVLEEMVNHIEKLCRLFSSLIAF